MNEKHEINTIAGKTMSINFIRKIKKVLNFIQ